MDHQKYSYDYYILKYLLLIHTNVLLDQDVCHYLCNEIMKSISQWKNIITNCNK
jgi:hypothetical protein